MKTQSDRLIDRRSDRHGKPQLFHYEHANETNAKTFRNYDLKTINLKSYSSLEPEEAAVHGLVLQVRVIVVPPLRDIGRGVGVFSPGSAINWFHLCRRRLISGIYI
jgi:hypothetical protein